MSGPTSNPLNTDARGRIQRGALYAGGFLGPFGGGVVTSMLPELGHDLSVSTADAATSLTAYLLPFAGLMLVSGTLGARWGRVRTVRAAYLVYLLASLGSVVAPDFGWFLISRVVQGSANAFTTPLLLAALAAATPRARLGRALGAFSALQAAGQTSAPLVGGLSAQVDWRIAFIATAAVSAVLALIGIPDAARHAPGSRPTRLREALRPKVLRIGVVALLGWGTLGGLSFLIAFRTTDLFGLGPSTRGLLLTGFGLAGMLAARPVGAMIDRIGARTTVIGGALAGAVLVAGAGLIDVLPVVAAAWALAGIAAQCVLVGVNAAVLVDEGLNRGGAVSVVQSFRFLGAALAPAVLTGLYGSSSAAAFLIPTLTLVVVAPLAMPRTRIGHDKMRAGFR